MKVRITYLSWTNFIYLQRIDEFTQLTYRKTPFLGCPQWPYEIGQRSLNIFSKDTVILNVDIYERRFYC